MLSISTQPCRGEGMSIYCALPDDVQEQINKNLDNYIYQQQHKPYQDEIIKEIFTKIEFGDIGEKPQHNLFGIKIWYKNNNPHRDYDLPATIIERNGIIRKIYMQHGKKHRDNCLPAVVDSTGYLAWWINGIKDCEYGVEAQLHSSAVNNISANDSTDDEMPELIDDD